MKEEEKKEEASGYNDKHGTSVKAQENKKNHYDVCKKDGTQICTIPIQEQTVKTAGVNGVQPDHLLWCWALVHSQNNPANPNSDLKNISTSAKK